MNNPKTRQEWIHEELTKEPNTSYSEMFSKYSVEFSKSEKTFSKDWNAAKQRHQDYQRKLQKEKEALTIQEDLKPLKNGLKTKNDRLLLLQKQIDQTEKELDTGVFTEMKREGKKVLKYDRPLTPYEKAMMRRTIKHLQSEISKIEGDYAPIKQDHTTNGESLNQSNVDLSKVDLETLKKLRDSQKTE